LKQIKNDYFQKLDSFLILVFVSMVLFGCNHHKDKKELESFNLSDYLNKDSIKIFQVSDIVDGDTYKILIQNQEFKVRLLGIDTPESSNNPKTRRDSQRGGQDVQEIIALGKLATEFVHNYLNEGDCIRLELDVEHFDRYDRILAYVYLIDGRMMNEILVREGYAQTMTYSPNVKYQELFLEANRDARENKRGLWADSMVTN